MDYDILLILQLWIALCSGYSNSLMDREFDEQNFFSKNDQKERPTEFELPKDGPRFLPNQLKNVTVLAGKNTKLSCRIMNLGNWTVSWIRHRDTHLISVGRFVYTADMRFRPVHKYHFSDPELGEENVSSYVEWSLEIVSPQKRDDGVYECQINTTPFRSYFINLRVIDPVTRILGLPEVFVDKGSTINLTCVVTQAPEPPNSIRWSQNNKAISYDSPRGGVTVVVEKGIQSSSSLIIQNARLGDSGNYSCKPDNAGPAYVMLHILNEFPAAMQHGGSLKQSSSQVIVMGCLLQYLLFRIQRTH